MSFLQGWKIPNSRLLADQYAAAGFYVYRE